jgi:hypothetical protein
MLVGAVDAAFTLIEAVAVRVHPAMFVDVAVYVVFTVGLAQTVANCVPGT